MTYNGYSARNETARTHARASREEESALTRSSMSAVTIRPGKLPRSALKRMVQVDIVPHGLSVDIHRVHHRYPHTCLVHVDVAPSAQGHTLRKRREASAKVRREVRERGLPDTKHGVGLRMAHRSIVPVLQAGGGVSHT